MSKTNRVEWHKERKRQTFGQPDGSMMPHAERRRRQRDAIRARTPAPLWTTTDIGKRKLAASGRIAARDFSALVYRDLHPKPLPAPEPLSIGKPVKRGAITRAELLPKPRPRKTPAQKAQQIAEVSAAAKEQAAKERRRAAALKGAETRRLKKTAAV